MKGSEKVLEETSNLLKTLAIVLFVAIPGFIVVGVPLIAYKALKK